MSAILFFLGILFALASVYATTRLYVSILLFAAGFGILYYIMKQRPVQITQRLEVSGGFKVKALECPKCSAGMDIKQIKIIGGVASITCPYCGHTFEVTEEPKW